MDASDRTFDLVILADLAPGRMTPDAPLRVDRDTLGELGKRLAPSVTVQGTPLTLDDPRAFRPEALAAALPLTRDLLALRRRLRETPAPTAPELRGAIEKLAGSVSDPDALRAALGGSAPAPQAPPPPAPVPPSRPAAAGRDGDPLDAIFGMVDAGAAAPAAAEAPAAANFLDRLIRSAADLSKSPDAVPTAALRALGQAVDEAMSGALRAALHDPRFQALEAAWAGLRFLVRRTDFRTGIRLHVVPCSRAEVATAFREVVGPFAVEQRREGRTIAALADFEFGLGDLAALSELALEAERVAPVLANASPGLLGLDSLARLDTLDSAEDTLADSDHADWNRLRDTDRTRWLALGINRVLLRLPYGAEQDRVREFAFEENPLGGEASYLWGGAAWAIAALMTASVERTGWGVEVAGGAEERTIGDLPVRPLTLRTGETLPCPLEVLMTEKRALELSRGGLVPLASRRARDEAFAPSAPVVHRDDPSQPGDAHRDTLACALFMSQLSTQIEHLLAWVDRSRSADEIATTLARGLEFLNETREGSPLAVTVEPSGERSLSLTVRPQRAPLRGLPASRLEIPLP